jgi:integrase
MASSKDKPQGAKVVRVGSVKIRVRPWKHPSGRPYWRATYIDAEGRTRDITRADRAEAIEQASRVAREIHNGIIDLSELPPDTIRMVRALLDLSPTWADIERWGAERTTHKITVEEAITRFIKWKVAESGGEKTRHLKLTESDLGCMALEVGGDTPLARIRSTQLAEWLDDLDVGAKRRKDYRAACVMLWRWARRQELIVVLSELTEPEKLPVPDVKKKDTVRIPSLDEVKFMFERVRKPFLPWLAICGFSGVRSGELRAHGKEPLDVSAIKLDRRIIDMPASISKNRKRRLIPISDTLAAWLEECDLPASGPIIPEPPYTEETARLGKLMDQHFHREEGWPANCLRHMFGSVRVAETKNVAAVSLEMDNSPTVIRDHYLEAMTEDDAKEYLSVLPGTF